MTRGSSWTRVTVLENSSTVLQTSVLPLMGAAVAGCGVAASGMWPSPANSPDVGSSPIQPAPGMYTSVHACRSVKSAGGPRRPVERLDVGCQLDQIAGHEPSGQSQLAQDRHQQPRRVPARADAAAQREIRCLDARFHPQAVADVGVDRAVERDQEVDGASAIRHREVTHPGLHEVAGARPVAVFVDGPQVRLEVIGQRLGVGQPAGRPRLGPVLDEEVERVDHLEVGDESDGDGQLAHGLRKHQPGQEVAHRVLLPVDEVVGRLDPQRVGLDGGAGVRRRAQPHDVRIYLDQLVKGVAGAVLQRNFDAHNR